MSTTTAKPRSRKATARKRQRRGSEPQMTRAQVEAGEAEQVAAALKHAKLDPSTELTAEQRTRAIAWPRGLRGEALRIWIMEGKTGTEQTREADEARAAAKATARSEAAKRPRSGNGGGRSTLQAAELVLKRARKPLHHSEIAKRIISGKLAPGLKGATPEQTISAALTMAAKRKQGFVKVSPGTFDLADRSTK